MTQAERRRIFRPHHVKGRLGFAENQFLRETRGVELRHEESIRLQLALGVKPDSLELDAIALRLLRDALVTVLIDTYATAAILVHSAIDQAKRAHYSRMPTFAVDREPIPEEWRQFYPQAGVQWYRDYALRIVGISDAAALEAAKQVIAEGVASGATQREIQRGLGDVFGVMSRNRLQRIARTETAKIYNQAEWQAYQADDDIVGYEIFGIMDSRICPICAARDHKVIPKERAEGNFPPWHANCRCVTSAIFAWEIADGSMKFDMPPKGAPKAARGFGTTDMLIPKPDLDAQQVIAQVGG
jgi:SPP1 gp7 family putative phage head morphogenesis protein